MRVLDWKVEIIVKCVHLQRDLLLKCKLNFISERNGEQQYAAQTHAVADDEVGRW